MTEVEERAWVEAARRGEETAFEQIFHHYKTSLFNLARHLVRNPDDAEDVVQQTFIKAFRALPRMRKPASLGPWLRRIVYTTSIDMLRRHKRQAEYPLDERLWQPSAPALNPEREAVLLEQVDKVNEALQLMPPRYRTYIVLREFDGLSYDEIAETLEEPVTTVRVALFRARQQLRELLRQIAGEEDNEA